MASATTTTLASDKLTGPPSKETAPVVPDKRRGEQRCVKRTFGLVRGMLWQNARDEDQETRGKGIRAWTKRLEREEKQALLARDAQHSRSEDSFFFAKTKTKTKAEGPNREGRGQSESLDALLSPRWALNNAGESDAEQVGKRDQRQAQAAAMLSLHPEMFAQQREQRRPSSVDQAEPTTPRG